MKDSSKKGKNMEKAQNKPKHKNMKVNLYNNSGEFQYGFRNGFGKLEVFKD